MRPESNRIALSISIVLFKPDVALLMRTLDSVRAAIGRLRVRYGALPVCVWLVNNENMPLSEHWSDACKGTEIQCEVIQGHGNIGYGRAHNLAIERARSQYHLILNPDVELAADALVQALRFFDAHPDIALIAPHASNQGGATQYLCRRYPTLFDLWLRGFALAWMRARFARPRDCGHCLCACGAHLPFRRRRGQKRQTSYRIFHRVRLSLF